ncbi:hypothetical protein [Leadbettera azotonutricia]|uniref:Uncharacterized protein n=1 Tax=Leadbettera azotonutricia (strain ATCC BAA-888 / DSM 13862 / ZAS-9) TaxID=545695 RepID=F5Y6N8_LEAAZ|nr:hypothetical protein [Leadbettera azotonutricia]AEF80395.1 hypothetical protein TREAZ_1232 [Leadbettera azotonutricia ZAS-9]
MIILSFIMNLMITFSCLTNEDNKGYVGNLYKMIEIFIKKPIISLPTKYLENYSLDDLIGKWYLLKEESDEDDNIHKSYSYYCIYKSDNVYKFEEKYYSSIYHGVLFIDSNGLYTFKYENNHYSYIIGPPRFTIDGKLAILIGEDIPTGFYQKVE